MIAEKQSVVLSKKVVRSERFPSGASHLTEQKSRRGPRVTLLTPYTGGNLGDAAIQDAMIFNLRLRLPGAEFSGISLNCDNFVERHGLGAFPLCASSRPFYGMSQGRVEDRSKEYDGPASGTRRESRGAILIKGTLKRVPALWRCLRMIRRWGASARREFHHIVKGYRFLRGQDVLIVSGGGQLDEEWGGPWGHPFALFKWAMLARIARIPYLVVSVGAGKAASRTSRLFLSAALRLARYRSYREENSRNLASGLFQRTAADLVVPDLVFSLPPSELPSPSGIRSISEGRTIIAISPIVYARSESWPHGDRAFYDRYLQQMASVMAQIVERGYFLLIVWSALADMESVVPELLARLDDESKEKLARQMHIPKIATWKDLVASLQDVDFLVASRLHSAIFGFLAHRPTVAISFDPKVDWLMQDLGQTDFLLQIHDFVAKDVLDALDRISLRRKAVVEQIASYQRQVLSVSDPQYDTIAKLAMANHRRRI